MWLVTKTDVEWLQKSESCQMKVYLTKQSRIETLNDDWQLLKNKTPFLAVTGMVVNYGGNRGDASPQNLEWGR